MCCFVWGFFCDPLTSIYKAVQQASYLHSYFLFASVFSSQLVYLYFRLPSLGIQCSLEKFLYFSRKPPKQVLSSNSKTALILSRLSFISRFLTIWSSTKIQELYSPLAKVQSRMHASCLGYMCLTVWTGLYFNQNAKCIWMSWWCLIGVSIDSALKQTEQSFAEEYLRCSKQLDWKSYLSCRSIEEESKIHEKNVISCLFLYIWIVGLALY